MKKGESSQENDFVAGFAVTAKVQDFLIIAMSHHLCLLRRLSGEIWESMALFEVIFQQMVYYLLYFICSMAGTEEWYPGWMLYFVM